MSKRKKNSSNILKIIAWILAVVALTLSAFAVGYFIGVESGKKEIIKKEKRKEQKRLELLKKIETKTLQKQESVSKRLKEVLKKEEKVKVKKEKIKEIEISKQIKQREIDKEVLKVISYAGASHEYATDKSVAPPSRIRREVKSTISDKPRLAIILDDVSVKSQVNAINSLGLNVTMSFLPPSSFRPNSAKLAAQQKFYMVHLPMEAQSFSAEEPDTLRISNTQEDVSQRIKSIKNLFPKVRYINNHTGSKYTSNETAMNKLIVALNSNNISFVDSRTTGKTKVPSVMKNFGLKYVARDVFLDHHTDKPYIIKQIKHAIKIAKNEGVAIAIGHPHANTILALHESKKLFKDVDLVFINKVY